jgi:hypothetical protein
VRSSFFALRTFVPLAMSLTVANALAVFLSPDWTLSAVLLPALAGTILVIYVPETRHSARFGTALGSLLLAWVVAVVIAVGLVALFVHSKDGRVEQEYLAHLGMYSLYAILLGAAAGAVSLIVVGRVIRLLSRAEAA